jgi:3-oxoacyl-[acyl-carrier-protein] synthase-3
LIIATQSPEQPMPHTGAFVGDRLGLRCGSFDLAAACSGFVYELVVGASMLATGCRNVLLVGAETVSRLMDPTDRSTTILFGDGAGAAVIVPAEGDEGLISWDLGCDGSAAALLEITAGGSRLPTSAATVDARQHYMTMAGQEVFRRAVRAVVESGNATLERAGVTANEIDWFVPHQANIRIIESAARKLGVPMEKTVVNIERYGNTSSASIPLALFEAVEDGRVKEGDLVLLCGFGAGMTWASALLRWGPQ